MNKQSNQELRSLIIIIIIDKNEYYELLVIAMQLTLIICKPIDEL